MLRTNATQRLRLNATQSYTIGSFATQTKDGALGLSPNNTLWTNGPGPFSRLHLHDGTTAVLTAAYRPWMDNGISFTTNGDQMYVGHKVEPGSDHTAAVIQWSDNDAPEAGPDVMKFIFTAGYSGAGTGNGSLNGLELGRFHPQGWLGLGDWQAAGVQPDERLDLLSRTIRLRDFTHPTLYRNNTYDRILVANPSDGRVYWRDASTLTASDCEWTLQGTPGSNSDVSTAYAGNTGCPQADKGVGIGIQVPKVKLHVRKDSFSATQEETAIKAETVRTVAGAFSYGVDATNTDAVANASYNVAVKGSARNGRLNYGVWGRAFTDPAFAYVDYGVYGEAVNSGSSTCFGVYGTASNGSGGGGPSGVWAGFFDGDVMIDGNGYLTGMVPIVSDSSLKTDVQDLVNAGELLGQLHPKTYEFLVAEHPGIHLPTGPQMGLIAQEVEGVIPQLVKQVTVPAKYDSTGTALTGPETIRTLNYMGLIPLLIAGYQEQQARLEQLEQQLAACCAAGELRSTSEDAVTPARATLKEALTIAPNPFTDRTTLTYTVPHPGQVRLDVATADGRPLKVLRQEEAQAGTFTYEWDTQGLSAGTYLCTLLLDGQVVVKRAVKVAR